MQNKHAREFIHLAIYVSFVLLYASGSLYPIINSMMENVSFLMFSWTPWVEYARFFKVSLLIALVVNAGVILFIEMMNRRQLSCTFVPGVFGYLFFRVIAYSGVFCFGVYAFVSRVSGMQSIEFVDYFYHAIVALIFSGVVNVWFDFLVSLINLIWRLK